MPGSAKDWCVHPYHNVIDPLTGKRKFIKAGRNPTHPCGIHRIDAATAEFINWRYLSVDKLPGNEVHDGDKVCSSCLRRISTDKCSHDYFDENITDENDQGQVNMNIEDLPSSQEEKYKQEDVRRKLNSVFELLSIQPIRDM